MFYNITLILRNNQVLASLSPIPKKENPTRAKQVMHGRDEGEGGTEQQKRKDTPSGVSWSGCCDVTEFICQSHHLHHQDLIQNTFELRSVDTAEIQNSNSRQNSGRHGVPTNGLNSRRIQNPKGFSTLRVVFRLPIQNKKW